MNRQIYTLSEIELREVFENGTKETITTCSKKDNVTLIDFTAIFEQVMTERIAHKLRHKNIPRNKIMEAIKHNMQLLNKIEIDENQ